MFAQIAARLAALAVLFGVLDVGIVVLDYLGDEQVMAEDLVGQQANRVHRRWLAHHQAPGGAPPPPVSAPRGGSDWAYAVFDASGRRIVAGGDLALLGVPALQPTLLDWTRRDATAGGVHITGLRRYEAGGLHWILVAATADDARIYLPVMGAELVDHVAVPFAPLTLLLLAFNIRAVRRMLGPLRAAAAEVDALAPGDANTRLTEPANSREVAALVAAVNRALDRLQQTMRLLKDFTADAAHELRTPLAVLQLRIETLPPGETRARLTEDVQAMTRLVNQMLEFTQAKALSLEGAAAVDLHRLAQEIVGQLAPLAFAAGHDIRLVDLGAPPIQGHPDALGRALRNLIDNAIAHAGRGGPIEVVVGPGPQVSVRDHGQGLGPGDAELLFRRFWRQRRDKGQGAGLGLGIARSIVEAHGGTLSARNAGDGPGAIFTLDLPAMRTQDSALDPRRS